MENDNLKANIDVLENPSSFDDSNLYDDVFQRHDKIQTEEQQLRSEVKELKAQLSNVEEKNNTLLYNISMLWKTAIAQLKMKCSELADIKLKYEALVMRRAMRTVPPRVLISIVKNLEEKNKVELAEFMKTLQGERKSEDSLCQHCSSCGSTDRSAKKTTQEAETVNHRGELTDFRYNEDAMHLLALLPDKRSCNVSLPHSRREKSQGPNFDKGLLAGSTDETKETIDKKSKDAAMAVTDSKSRLDVKPKTNEQVLNLAVGSQINGTGSIDDPYSKESPQILTVNNVEHNACHDNKMPESSVHFLHSSNVLSRNVRDKTEHQPQKSKHLDIGEYRSVRRQNHRNDEYISSHDIERTKSSRRLRMRSRSVERRDRSRCRRRDSPRATRRDDHYDRRHPYHSNYYGRNRVNTFSELRQDSDMRIEENNEHRYAERRRTENSKKNVRITRSSSTRNLYHSRSSSLENKNFNKGDSYNDRHVVLDSIAVKQHSVDSLNYTHRSSRSSSAGRRYHQEKLDKCSDKPDQLLAGDTECCPSRPYNHLVGVKHSKKNSPQCESDEAVQDKNSDRRRIDYNKTEQMANSSISLNVGSVASKILTHEKRGNVLNQDIDYSGSPSHRDRRNMCDEVKFKDLTKRKVNSDDAIGAQQQMIGDNIVTEVVNGTDEGFRNGKCLSDSNSRNIVDANNEKIATDIVAHNIEDIKSNDEQRRVNKHRHYCTKGSEFSPKTFVDHNIAANRRRSPVHLSNVQQQNSAVLDGDKCINDENCTRVVQENSSSSKNVKDLRLENQNYQELMAERERLTRALNDIEAEEHENKKNFPSSPNQAECSENRAIQDPDVTNASCSDVSYFLRARVQDRVDSIRSLMDQFDRKSNSKPTILSFDPQDIKKVECDIEYENMLQHATLHLPVISSNHSNINSKKKIFARTPVKNVNVHNDTIDNIIQKYNENLHEVSLVPSEISLLDFLHNCPRSGGVHSPPVTSFSNVLEQTNLGHWNPETTTVNTSGNADSSSQHKPAPRNESSSLVTTAPSINNDKSVSATTPRESVILVSSSDTQCSSKNAIASKKWPSFRSGSKNFFNSEGVPLIRRLRPIKIMDNEVSCTKNCSLIQEVEFVPVRDYSINPKTHLPTSSIEVIHTDRYSFKGSPRRKKGSVTSNLSQHLPRKRSSRKTKSQKASNAHDVVNENELDGCSPKEMKSKNSFLHSFGGQQRNTRLDSLKKAEMLADLGLTLSDNSKSVEDDWYGSPAKNTRSKTLNTSKPLIRIDSKGVGPNLSPLSKKNTTTPDITNLKSGRTPRSVSRKLEYSPIRSKTLSRSDNLDSKTKLFVRKIYLSEDSVCSESTKNIVNESNDDNAVGFNENYAESVSKSASIENTNNKCPESGILCSESSISSTSASVSLLSFKSSSSTSTAQQDSSKTAKDRSVNSHRENASMATEPLANSLKSVPTADEIRRREIIARRERFERCFGYDSDSEGTNIRPPSSRSLSPTPSYIESIPSDDEVLPDIKFRLRSPTKRTLIKENVISMKPLTDDRLQLPATYSPVKENLAYVTRLTDIEHCGSKISNSGLAKDLEKTSEVIKNAPKEVTPVNSIPQSQDEQNSTMTSSKAVDTKIPSCSDLNKASYTVRVKKKRRSFTAFSPGNAAVIQLVHENQNEVTCTVPVSDLTTYSHPEMNGKDSAEVSDVNKCIDNFGQLDGSTIVKNGESASQIVKSSTVIKTPTIYNIRKRILSTPDVDSATTSKIRKLFDRHGGDKSTSSAASSNADIQIKDADGQPVFCTTDGITVGTPSLVKKSSGPLCDFNAVITVKVKKSRKKRVAIITSSM